ncbi:MAG TPA: thiamine pyrophosphate-dependent dehydrogenase E1 component subunit alpha [Actinomycetota bacterium]|nr:thiamine pyrophosphate-dependent dehydrogenase E1 component subunit alpha [Actinomycetota bacterium]
MSTRERVLDEPFLQVIAPDGTAVGEPDPALSVEDLRELFRLMVRARHLDRGCLALQRQGELTVYPPFEGQEASQVGSAFALSGEDFVFPSFRELAAAITRGVDVLEYLQYHRGTWHGGAYDPFRAGFAPICVPVATQIVHAVGWALGAKLDHRRACSLAYFGDGSTSEGDFHEAANIAAVFQAPIVLFCQNNGWAISVPLEEQLAGPIWRRAEGYGFPGVRVDGNDVLAVHRATKEAADRARHGDGPTLIEAITYRMGPHSTADDPSRYRTREAVAAWRGRDPIERFRRYLLHRQLVDEHLVSTIEEEARTWVRGVREELVGLAPPPAQELSAFAFERPPEGLGPVAGSTGG